MIPDLRGPAWIAVGLALLGAGCAASPGAPASPQEAEAAAALTAFFHVCGRLEPGEMERRSRGLGFVPVDPARLPTPPPPGAQVMARPPAAEGGVAALLTWNDRTPSCEMAVAGVSPAAAEGVFNARVEVLSANPSVQLRAVQIPAGAPRDASGLVIRRMVLLLARDQAPPRPHLVLLRTAEAAAPGRAAAVFSVVVGRPRSEDQAIPPPSAALAPPKD